MNLTVSLRAGSVDVQVESTSIGFQDYGIEQLRCDSPAGTAETDLEYQRVFYTVDGDPVITYTGTPAPDEKGPMGSFELVMGEELSLACVLSGTKEPWEFDINRETLGLPAGEGDLCAAGHALMTLGDGSMSCRYFVGFPGEEVGRAAVNLLLILERDAASG